MWRQQQTEYSNWLAGAGKAQATIIAYNKDIEQFIEFLIKGGIADAKQVEAEDFNRYKTELEALRYTDKSISRKLNSLKSFFRYLRKTEAIAENPLQMVSHPKYKVSLPRILTKTEYRALRDACRADQRMSAIIEILLQTGLRISELAALRVEDINVNKRELVITPQGSHPSRIVPLNNTAIQAIESYTKIRPRAKEAIFFLTKSCRPFLVRNIRSAIDRYFRIASIKEAKVNDLRHTFIVEQLSAGVPLLTVSQIVGHKRISTTERYLQFLEGSTTAPDITIREL